MTKGKHTQATNVTPTSSIVSPAPKRAKDNHSNDKDIEEKEINDIEIDAEVGKISTEELVLKPAAKVQYTINK